MSNTNTVTLPLVHVLVARSNDMKINARVPEHEIEVLRACHGRANVHVQPPEEYPEEVAFDISADAEWLRLIRKYQRKNEADPAKIAYPRGARDLIEFGFEMGHAFVEEAPASAQVDFAKEARKQAAEAKKAQKAAAKKD